SAARAQINRDLRGSSRLPAPQNRTTNRESRSSSEGTDNVDSSIPEFFEMFSQNHSRQAPQSWWYVYLSPPTYRQNIYMKTVCHSSPEHQAQSSGELWHTVFIGRHR